MHESLASYLAGNAVFLAERLVACRESAENLALLGRCYYRAGQTARAYHTLKAVGSPEARYLFALCCKEMGRLSEAELALLPARMAAQPGAPPPQSQLEQRNDATGVPHGAAGLLLLGQLCRATDRRKDAVGYLQRALRLDPFLWTAYEELCAMGADEEAREVYAGAAAAAAAGAGGGATAYREALAALGQAVAGGGETSALGDGVAAMAITPDVATALGFGADVGATPVPNSVMPTTAARAQYRTPYEATPVGMAPLDGVTPTPGGPDFVTPTPGGTTADDVEMEATPTRAGAAGGAAEPPALARGGKAAAAAAHWGGEDTGGSHKVTDDGRMRKVANGRLFSAGMDSGTPAPRRSSRLAGKAASASRDGAAGGHAVHGLGLDSCGGAGSAAGPHPTAHTHAGLTPGALQGTGAAMALAAASSAGAGGRSPLGGALVLQLLHTLGEGVRHLAMYRCQEAIDAFVQLPASHYATGWVQCQVGRAHFEMVEYAEAERAFQWARRVCPHRLEGMEVYSTVLWHLKKEADLSFLAKETIAHDRHSPEAWCAMGNCFSLQREHEAAIRFFQRALQLRPGFTYAHTLCGHEYFTNEDYDKGLTCYRGAIRIDARHYNAWYGLGAIYLRQEKYDLAEHHFRRALNINPRSSVLHCYLGMAIHRNGRHGEALKQLCDGIALDPKNALAKFQKANVLMAVERYHDALAELEALKAQAPREASLYFLMGKIYKRLEQPDRAMVHFSLALDLKPSSSDANAIKAAIEKLSLPDDEPADDAIDEPADDAEDYAPAYY